MKNNETYISLGMQCTTTIILKNLNKRKKAYPFDWALTHLGFMDSFIKEIYKANNLDHLYDFVLDLKNNEVHAVYTSVPEKFILTKTENTKTIYNRKQKIIFPHDEYNQETINKLKKRILRFKNNLLERTNEIVFLYASPPNENSHLLIDGVNLTFDNIKYLNKIASFLEEKEVNFKIIYIDSLNESTQLHSKITKINTPFFANGGDMANWCSQNLQMNI
jgi:hypothetical protein